FHLGDEVGVPGVIDGGAVHADEEAQALFPLGMKGLAGLAELVEVVSVNALDFDFTGLVAANSGLPARVEEASLAALDALQSVAAQRAGDNEGRGREYFLKVFQAQVVKVLVAEKDDVGLLPLRYLKWVGINDLGPGDAERIVRDACEIEIEELHIPSRVFRLSVPARGRKPTPLQN